MTAGMRPTMPQRDVADRAQRARQRGEPGQPVGQRDHLHGRSDAGRRAYSSSTRVRPAAKHRRQRVGQGDRVLDAEVHALTARRAVHVGGVAREQDPAARGRCRRRGGGSRNREPQTTSVTVMPPGPRGRRGAAERTRPTAPRARRRRVRRCGSAPSGSGATTVRPSLAQNSRTSSVGASPRQVDVGEDERVLVGAAGEADARPARARCCACRRRRRRSARGRCRRRRTWRSRPWRPAVTVASTLGRTTSPPSSRTRSSSSRSVVDCGTMQRERVGRRQPAEVDREQHVLAPSRMAKRGASMPSLTRRRVTSRPSSTSSVRALTAGGAGGVRAFGLPVDEHDAARRLTSNDAASVRPVGPAPTMRTSVSFMVSLLRFDSNANACWHFHRAPRRRKSQHAVGLHSSAWVAKADQTKAVILAAARERFAESGYEAATIRAIAADANIDPSMVMRYFGNKDQLFAAAAEFDLQFPDLSDVAPERPGPRAGVALPVALGGRRRAGRAAAVGHHQCRSGATHDGHLRRRSCCPRSPSSCPTTRRAGPA